ncbi:MAG: helix-turn-helix domain-containing protein [Pseudomonadota bacterium]
MLDGRYTEIGDTGAWTATSGSVIAHAPSETHHGAISGQSAEVLLLPSRRASATPPNTLDDIDEAIRLSRQSLSEAADFVLEQFKPAELRAFDWPAELAAALREDSTLQINDWTHSRGIDKSVASREFRKVFQYSPSRFRLKSKVHKAVDLLISSEEPLATVAQKSGFSDQAHMCRSLVAMTG